MIVIPLYYTSFLLIIPAFYAYYRNNIFMHHSSIALTMFSILQHSKYGQLYYGKELVYIIDHCISHYIAVYLSVKVFQNKSQDIIWLTNIYWASLAFVISWYYLITRHDTEFSYKVHGLIHVAYVIGTCVAIEVIDVNKNLLLR